MNNSCDIFFPSPFFSKNIRLLSLLDKRFSYKDNFEYSGYMGVCVNRVKLVPLVSLLRREGGGVYSVPVDYRDGLLLPKNDALVIASRYGEENGLKIISGDSGVSSNPLVWGFSSVCLSEEKAGGVVMVDKLDGHIWTLDELDVYMYDYNNLF